MATTIKQNGFDFTYIHKVPGSLPDVQTWGIEKVASFMFLIEFHRLESQRYQKGFTRISRYGRIQYELEEIDDKTYSDLDLMTKRLNLIVSSDKDRETLYLMEFTDGLDFLEAKLKTYIEDANKPVEVFGKSFIPGTEFTRPSKEEYDELLAEKRAREDEEARLLAERRTKTQTSSITPVATGQIIRFDFIKHGVLECKVIGVVGRSYICEVYKDGKCIDNACKIGRTSKRIVG